MKTQTSVKMRVLGGHSESMFVEGSGEGFIEKRTKMNEGWGSPTICVRSLFLCLDFQNKVLYILQFFLLIIMVL